MTTPAGWYDDGSGRQRWWDGEQWTEHFAADAAAESPAESSPSNDAEPVQDAAAPAQDAEPEIPPVPEMPAAAPASDASDLPASAANDATASIDDTVIRPSADAAASDSAPSFSAPEEPAPSAGDAGLPTYAAPAPVQPEPQAYGSAPAYPGAAPAYGAAPGQPGAAYPGGNAAYPVAGGGYPAASPAADAPKKLSVLGLVGLGLAVLGTILVFIPFVGAFGFVLLGVGFILSIVSLFLKGKKWPGIAGLSLAIVGTILGIVMFFVYLVGFASAQIDEFPSDFPSEIATEPEETGDADASEEPLDTGERPTADELAPGLAEAMGLTESDFSEGAMLCLAEALVASDMSDESLQTLASGSAALTDANDAQIFADVATDSIATCATQ